MSHSPLYCIPSLMRESKVTKLSSTPRGIHGMTAVPLASRTSYAQPVATSRLAAERNVSYGMPLSRAVARME